MPQPIHFAVNEFKCPIMVNMLSDAFYTDSFLQDSLSMLHIVVRIRMYKTKRYLMKNILRTLCITVFTVYFSGQQNLIYKLV